MTYSTFHLLLLPFLLLTCKSFILPTNSQNNLMNTIDACWRSNPNWASNRQALADCAKGFGSETMGGKNGTTYIVTDSSDNDPSDDPKPGTLRYGAIQKNPLWIVFAKDMIINLKSVLSVSSYKTIDGRGFKVEFANGPCIEVHRASHVIIHGISIHDCEAQRAGLGDGITIFASSHVWIDHCSISACIDGSLDVIRGSTGVTISNNYFTKQDKVILLGNDDGNEEDNNMKVTVAFNYFGRGLVQRMPRIRQGYVHVANNRYERWQNYAIGGSANPTILSEGNHYIAATAKEVTQRLKDGADWKNWTWKSSRDVFENGAYFVASGSGNPPTNYSPSQSFTVAHGSMVFTLTSNAGPLECDTNKPC